LVVGSRADDQTLATSNQRLLRSSSMELFSLTRHLIDIESITPNEGAVGNFLFDELRRRGFDASRMQVEGQRANVLATWPGHPEPLVVFSTHMDTVPPFIASSEDDTRIYGRGSCDAKGIIAAQVLAAEKLRAEGIHVGLLFLVGEERDSLGAKMANRNPIGARFLINGEPTENKLALASRNWGNRRLTSWWKRFTGCMPWRYLQILGSDRARKTWGCCKGDAHRM
jgi:acetylornithine deacetylase/succinyl-diaminopimelate desuccinylase-like protein